MKKRILVAVPEISVSVMEIIGEMLRGNPNYQLEVAELILRGEQWTLGTNTKGQCHITLIRAGYYDEIKEICPNSEIKIKHHSDRGTFFESLRNR